MTAEYLKEKWNEINYYDGGFMQIEIKHPLEWYIGYKEEQQKVLMLITEAEPEKLPSSKSIEISKGLRSDDRWTLSFTLLHTEQQSVFFTLCADIASFSQNACTEKEGLRLLSKRYKQWNRLLEHQVKSLMSESSRKGLLGEMIFLNEILQNGRPLLEAVQGWVGPDGADQDFVYQNGWYEIKSVGISASSVSISSLEQLDRSESGELVLMRLDKAAPEQKDAVSLGSMAEYLCDALKDDPDALILFEYKLLEYGYIDLPEYYEQKYFFTKKDCFTVDKDFPRLTAQSVMPQIISADYSISIPGIEHWRKEE